MDRSTSWSVTINNPAVSDEECINLARQKGWKVEGQIEKGEEGTPHYQLHVKTPQVRFAAVKKMFPRGHIEIARNATALANYVRKDETRVGELPTTQEAYPSLQAFWALLFDVAFDDEDFYTVMKYGKDYDKNLAGCPAPKFDLVQLDKWSSILIERGYVVESLVANPATRSMFKLFAASIFERQRVRNAAQRLVDSQTDRQSETITLPTVNAEEDDESSSQGSQESSGSSSGSEDSEGSFESDSYL